MATASEEEKKEENSLQNEWILWKHDQVGGGNNKSASAWTEAMKPLCTIRTVQDFWRYWQHIPTPSQVFFDGESHKKVGVESMKRIEEFSLFKKGIEPEWGDPLNVKGGEWFCRVTLEGEVLDLYWQNLAMALVGEVMEDAVDSMKPKGAPDVINGCRVVDKSRNQYPMFKIELWISSRDEAIRDKVKDKLMEVISDTSGSAGGGPPIRRTNLKFEWKDHSP